METILETDRVLFLEEWHKMSVLRLKRTFEVRLKKKWHHKQSDTWKNVWILASFGHDVEEDGSLKSIMGFITDISLQKQAQEDAVERAVLSEQLARSQKEANEIQISSRMKAEEARRRMEKFMDITSHEMRNPLSAILQSADGIATSLSEFQDFPKPTVDPDEFIKNTLEAVQIIIVSQSFISSQRL